MTTVIFTPIVDACSINLKTAQLRNPKTLVTSNREIFWVLLELELVGLAITMILSSFDINSASDPGQGESRNLRRRKNDTARIVDLG